MLKNETPGYRIVETDGHCSLFRETFTAWLLFM
uniref:Uncharacterized protein n=1 Tax=Arundo donax TaxID=35708 RepID=A0A0A9HJ11_ARUDO